MIFSCLAHFSVSSPDYLNNLSPDSKEYEDTQGKTCRMELCEIHDQGLNVIKDIVTHAAAAPHVSGPIC